MFIADLPESKIINLEKRVAELEKLLAELEEFVEVYIQDRLSEVEGRIFD